MLKRTSQYYKDLLTELVKKEIKVRYKNSILGYLWSILLPLSQALIFFFAFKFVMRIQVPNYALFLVVALFPWQWLLNSIIASSTSLITNANLIKKTIFPREYIIMSGVLNDMIHFMLSWPVIVLFMVIYHKPLTLALFALPILVVLQFFFTYGFAMFVAAVNVFFRDLERLISVFLNILFYATPIIYSETMIPDKFRSLIYFNPVTSFVITYRSIFIEGTVAWKYLGIAAIYSLVVFLFGRAIFNSLKWKFAEAL